MRGARLSYLLKHTTEFFRIIEEKNKYRNHKMKGERNNKKGEM
jgi:hypothetical protein